MIYTQLVVRLGKQRLRVGNEDERVGEFERERWVSQRMVTKQRFSDKYSSIKSSSQGTSTRSDEHTGGGLWEICD